MNPSNITRVIRLALTLWDKVKYDTIIKNGLKWIEKKFLKERQLRKGEN